MARMSSSTPGTTPGGDISSSPSRRGGPGERHRRARRSLWARERWDAWFLFVATLGLVVAFAASEPAWLNSYTLQSLLTQNAPLALVAVAMTFAIISSHIDLSPGSMIALTGTAIGLVFQATGSLALALVSGLATALAVGLLQGALVAGLGLNAIIVTLATYIWASGLAVGANSGVPIAVHGGLANVVNASFAGFTLTAPVVVASYLAGAYLLSRTKLGRYTHAMGGDAAAVRRAGVNVTLYTIAIFTLMGIAVALASVITVGQLGTADPTAGTNIELDAIISVYRRQPPGGGAGKRLENRARSRVPEHPQQRPAQPRPLGGHVSALRRHCLRGGAGRSGQHPATGGLGTRRRFRGATARRERRMRAARPGPGSAAHPGGEPPPRRGGAHADI